MTCLPDRRILPPIAPLLDRPFALYGHGSGALAAFETSRALQAHGRPAPLRLFVSGLRAPHLSATPLRSPITVFCGLQDEELEPSCLEAWQELTDCDCELCLLPGGTTFLAENEHLVTTALLRRLAVGPSVRRERFELMAAGVSDH